MAAASFDATTMFIASSTSRPVTQQGLAVEHRDSQLLQLRIRITSVEAERDQARWMKARAPGASTVGAVVAQLVGSTGHKRALGRHRWLGWCHVVSISIMRTQREQLRGQS